MSIQDIEAMIKTKNLSNKKEEFTEQKTIDQMKKSMMPKKTISFVPRRTAPCAPPFHVQIPLQNEIVIKDDPQIKSGIKKAVFKVASMPMMAPKRDIFNEKLHENEFLNNYVDNNVYLRWFQNMSNDMKALACYGAIYVDVYKN